MRATRLIERSQARLAGRIARVGDRVAAELLAAIEAVRPVAPLRPAILPVLAGGPTPHPRRRV